MGERITFRRKTTKPRCLLAGISKKGSFLTRDSKYLAISVPWNCKNTHKQKQNKTAVNRQQPNCICFDTVRQLRPGTQMSPETCVASARLSSPLDLARIQAGKPSCFIFCHVTLTQRPCVSKSSFNLVPELKSRGLSNSAISLLFQLLSFFTGRGSQKGSNSVPKGKHSRLCRLSLPLPQMAQLGQAWW